VAQVDALPGEVIQRQGDALPLPGDGRQLLRSQGIAPRTVAQVDVRRLAAFLATMRIVSEAKGRASIPPVPARQPA